MMKVLIQTNVPAPYTVAFFNELAKFCELTVLYERHSASDRDSTWISQDKRQYREIYLQGKKIGTENSFCPSITKYLRRDYDVIVIGMYSTYTAMWAIASMKRRRMPYFLSTDGGMISNDSILKKKLKTWLIGGASGWLSSGKEASKYLAYYGADSGRITEYPFTSLSTEEIASAPASTEEKQTVRTELKLPVDKKIVLGVGQFIHRKGWDVLLSIADRLPQNTEIYLVGGEKQILEDFFGAIPQHVHTISFVTKEEITKYYKASDLFVLPTREDIWGLVINEAMACGLPVITTTKCVAGLELVENGVNGYLTEPEDAEGLLKAIQNVLQSDFAVMGQASLKKIENYTYTGMAKAYMKAFEQVIGNNGNK